MMGRQEVAQAPLFYSFNLDTHIPANHLLRGIDRFLDFISCRACRGHQRGWARPTTAPSHEVRCAICRGRVIRCVGKCLRGACEEILLRIHTSLLTPEMLGCRV